MSRPVVMSGCDQEGAAADGHFRQGGYGRWYSEACEATNGHGVQVEHVMNRDGADAGGGM